MLIETSEIYYEYTAHTHTQPVRQTGEGLAQADTQKHTRITHTIKRFTIVSKSIGLRNFGK